MGLRINNNIASLTAQHQLSKNSRSLSTSLERLSSGLRINKGSDDVVGLLTSENLRSQIRGIGVAELNISNATSLLGVAEGSLANLTDVAQQIREKVVQAANASISSADRDNLRTSIGDLVQEYSRLTNASSFNNVSLLTGSFANQSFQIGPTFTDSLSFSIDDTRAAAVGKVAVLTSLTIKNASTTTQAATAFTDPSNVTINGITLASASFTNDGVSSYEASESAIAYVNAINSYSGQTKVTAQVLANVYTLATYSGQSDIKAGDTLQINGVTIAAAAYSASNTGGDALAVAINNVSTLTGVTASNDNAASLLILTAADGRNIAIKYVSTDTGQFGFGTTSFSGFVTVRGTFKLFSDAAFTTGGNASTVISATTSVALSTSFTLTNLDVSTASNASTGLFILDNVIRQLQNRRSNIGSKTVRFGVAQAELSTRKENLSSAESVIRDTDVAEETANLTKAQILQQAGATVLARANSIPQIALSLLQG